MHLCCSILFTSAMFGNVRFVFEFLETKTLKSLKISIVSYRFYFCAKPVFENYFLESGLFSKIWE